MEDINQIKFVLLPEQENQVKQMLWESKLKSREAFKTFLEFLPLCFDQFEDVMNTVTPLSDVGNWWYQTHINPRP